MRFVQTLLSVVSVFAVIMLVPPTTVLAGRPSCSTTDFDITVTATHGNGRSTYVYNLTRAGANPSKLFMYLKRGSDDPTTGDFRFHCAGGSFSAPNCSGEYKANGSPLTGGPISSAWVDNTHNDGLQLTSVAVGTFPITINVTERQPGREQEDETTILLPVGNKLQACGPIEGPMQAQKQSFTGSPLVATNAELCFANGCCYNTTVGLTTNIITSMTPSPDTLSETESPSAACAAVVSDCETDTGLVHCPAGEVGRPPVQTEVGGTCYYGNIKFTC